MYFGEGEKDYFNDFYGLNVVMYIIDILKKNFVIFLIIVEKNRNIVETYDNALLILYLL